MLLDIPGALSSIFIQSSQPVAVSEIKLSTGETISLVTEHETQVKRLLLDISHNEPEREASPELSEPLAVTDLDSIIECKPFTSSALSLDSVIDLTDFDPKFLISLPFLKDTESEIDLTDLKQPSPPFALETKSASDNSSTNFSPSAHPAKTFSPETDRPLSNQSQLIEEILGSEDSYIKSLRLFDTIFLSMLIQRSSANFCAPLHNLKSVVGSILQSHDAAFGGVLRSANSIATAMRRCMEQSALYALYNINATLVAKLIEGGVAPFDAMFLRSIQRFLELHQPKSHHMDLSFKLFLRRPVARVGQYRLFLSDLSKQTDSAHVRECLDSVVASLTRCNELARTERLDQLDRLDALVDYSSAPGRTAHFYGFFSFFAQCHAMYVSCTRPDRAVKDAPVGLILHENHLMISDWSRSTARLTFLLPLSACQFLEALGDVGGLYHEGHPTLKIIFQDGGRRFEVLLASYTKGEYKALEAEWAKLPHGALDFGATYEECYFPRRTAIYDIDIRSGAVFRKHRKQCYFKEQIRCERNIKSVLVQRELSKRLRGPGARLK